MANTAEIQEGIIAAVTSKLGDNTDEEQQFFSMSQQFKKSKVTGEQFVQYSIQTLGRETAGVVLPQMILLLAKYPERQTALHQAIEQAKAAMKAQAAGQAEERVQQEAAAAQLAAQKRAQEGAAAEQKAQEAAQKQVEAAAAAQQKAQQKAQGGTATKEKREQRAAAPPAPAPAPTPVPAKVVKKASREKADPQCEAAKEGQLGMGGLVPLIQKVQDALLTVKHLNMAQMVDLPQIVVIGSQSAGKSSVLESIVGHEFLPRGPNICTRRPLVLHLYTSEETYGEFSHRPGDKFFSFVAIKEEIQAETDRVAGSNLGISPHPIALKVYSPHVLNLTLVDTPGVTKVAVGDQPKNIEIEIRKMILQFIERPTCLILALTAANTDLANSDALKLAKEVDPEGHRTIGVLTKLDLMDAGTHAGAVLTNRVVPLKHGYVGVINRSQKDIMEDKSILRHLNDEEAYMDGHPVYSSLENVGTRELSKRLNSVLVGHIAAALPELRVRISASLKTVTGELEQMGFSELTEDTDNVAGGILLSLLTSYANEVKNAIEGCTRPLNSKMMVGGARIAFIFDEILVPEMAKLNPMSGLTDEDIRTAMRNSKGAKTWLFIPEDSFEMLAKRQVSQLEGPAVQCVDLVLAELQTLCGECEMKDIRKFANLPIEVMTVVNEMVHEFSESTTKMVKNLVAVETTHINLQHPDFADVIQTMMETDEASSAGVQQEAMKNREEQSKSQGFASNFFSGQDALNREKRARDAQDMKMRNHLTVTETGDMSVREQRGLELIHHMLERYFSVIRRKICDQTSKAIMSGLVNRMKDELAKTLVRKLYRDNSVLDMLKETEDVRLRRGQLKQMKDALEGCLNILDQAHSMGARISL
eukprot:TRINITY_DN2569_c0_g1_i5.p1 TRINITY_DN2569_c0_g1~~TRINITY_DN2569_c0_g1_i5.p1  ORF type:complete len:872 (+),score=206.41 TRINITY_DN2569_c0_g1_i5:85-2700(+)